jgi:tetratricopeptide (TPR) repeat protein
MSRLSSQTFIALIALAGLLMAPAAATACLWDYDTLKQERARFPSALELITGKFLRHSKEFYEWRIQDRLKKIAADPKNPALHDDLAAAYDKTGQHEKAIETMRKVEAFAPGRYETYANLGTFYFHSGKLEEGLPYIDKALAINPDAHFGRERYQKWLVEYILERRDKEGMIPSPLLSKMHSFSNFLAKKQGVKSLTKEQNQAAVKGILGMMRFGKHDAPVLLEVLGDLLISHSQPDIDAKQLAARAFLQAANKSENDMFRQFAERALGNQTVGDGTTKQLTLEELETTFKVELAEAAEWYEKLRGDELRWIREGLDPEAEFDRLYTEEPTMSGEIAPSDEYPGDPRHRALDRLILGLKIGGSIIALLIGFFVVRWFVRQTRGPSPNPPPD